MFKQKELKEIMLSTQFTWSMIMSFGGALTAIVLD